MAYPTAYDFLYRMGAVRRTDAMTCQNALADLRRQVTERADLGARLDAVAAFFTARHLARRYDLEARVHGFKLPG